MKYLRWRFILEDVFSKYSSITWYLLNCIKYFDHDVDKIFGCAYKKVFTITVFVLDVSLSILIGQNVHFLIIFQSARISFLYINLMYDFNIFLCLSDLYYGPMAGPWLLILLCAHMEKIRNFDLMKAFGDIERMVKSEFFS